MAYRVIDRRHVYDRDGWLCYRCRRVLMNKASYRWAKRNGRVIVSASVDHLIPVSRGGGDEPENLRACCRECNGRRGNRPLDGEEMAVVGWLSPVWLELRRDITERLEGGR